MKALILAAGMGARLRPLNLDLPKPLIEFHFLEEERTIRDGIERIKVQY